MKTRSLLWPSDVVVNRDYYISIRIQHLEVEIIIYLEFYHPNLPQSWDQDTAHLSR
jgi:hypothetical protein